MRYEDWLGTRENVPAGDSIPDAALSGVLFPFQRDLTEWALRRGRSALFADTGLGKTLMQCEWSRVVSENRGRVLILAPLAVAQQTVREAREKLGLAVEYARADTGAPITITNYEMLDHFDPAEFAGIVLDESSILKAFDGKTRNAVIGAFGETPFRLACTATPAPNDHMELGNHSEFLGVKSRSEMLAEFFVHDGGSTQNWRVKGHAKDAFWAWVCSWAAMVRKPSDLGYSDEGFDLPPLEPVVGTIAVDDTTAHEAGMLFVPEAVSLTDQRAIRRATIDARVRMIAEEIAKEPDEPALIWCDYNVEGDALGSAIADAVQVRGADKVDDKAARLLGFADGTVLHLVTKAKIAGFGMNWQHCARVYFMGPSHSYEQTYQAIRRCWRFGQKRAVRVFTCAAETETAVLRNYARKEQEAREMAEHMLSHVSRAAYQSGESARRQWDSYEPGIEMEVPEWVQMPQLA